MGRMGERKKWRKRGGGGRGTVGEPERILDDKKTGLGRVKGRERFWLDAQVLQLQLTCKSLLVQKTASPVSDTHSSML